MAGSDSSFRRHCCYLIVDSSLPPPSPPRHHRQRLLLPPCSGPSSGPGSCSGAGCCADPCSGPCVGPTPAPSTTPSPTPALAPGKPEFDSDNPSSYGDPWAIDVLRQSFNDLNDYLVHHLKRLPMQPPLVENITGFVYTIFRVAEVIKDLP